MMNLKEWGFLTIKQTYMMLMRICYFLEEKTSLNSRRWIIL